MPQSRQGRAGHEAQARAVDHQDAAIHRGGGLRGVTQLGGVVGPRGHASGVDPGGDQRQEQLAARAEEVARLGVVEAAAVLSIFAVVAGVAHARLRTHLEDTHTPHVVVAH